MKKSLFSLAIAACFLISGCGGSPSENFSAPSQSSPAADGRARLLAQSGQPAVNSIDSLGGPSAQFVYSDIARFSDANPDLTGTIQQACQGLGLSAQLFGPNLVSALLFSVSPDSGQSLCSSLNGNLDPATPDGFSRCRDAFTVVGASQQSGGRNPEVQSRLSPELSTMPKFHSLRLLWPGAVPPAQRAVLKQLRDSLTYPPNGTPVQKVLKVSDMTKYLNGTFDPRIFGFQAVVSDVASLTTPAQIIEGLRLDYSGGFQNETQLGILSYQQRPGFTLTPPYSIANGGTRTDAYPFAGNGFTATVKANAIPEWVLPSAGIEVQEGDTLTLVQADGSRVLQATFQSGHWVDPMGTILSRQQTNRARVHEWIQYQGHSLLVLSQDDQFRYVYSDQALPSGFLLDQVQVGPSEYRGRIPL